MFTIIAFLLTIAGSINWLLIGLLQYDFVAGIFGFQASVFSRLIYIIIGSASVFLVFKLFKGKGTIAVFSRNNKKDLAKHIQKFQEHSNEKAYNAEASREHFDISQPYYDDQYDEEYSNNFSSQDNNSLFDENLDDD